MTRHDFGDDIGNIREAAVPGKKEFHGRFVGGIHHDAGSAPVLQRLPCQRDGGEGFRVGFKEFQRPAGEQIEPRRVHR